MKSKYLVVIGDSRDMREVASDSVQLVVTSPPYFNVKDYGRENIGSINEFYDYLMEMQLVFNECYRVLEKGRYCCINVGDVISEGEKYPIPAHFVIMLKRAGFDYREDIIWRKPSGVGARGGSGAGKRFGVFMQHPYPMYYFPNNIFEHILVFRKGKFDYKKASEEQKRRAKVDVEEAKRRWNSDVWEFHPETRNQYSELTHPAMFPEELPEGLIRLYAFKGETVLDPFLGSGTTLEVARNLERSCIGYEINPAYLPLIRRKAGFDESGELEIVNRGGDGNDRG
ncbi:Modification methylase MjaI [Candidatus Burarchaeum australiense]|nr:Modification methylase MjaI [Candidatus Burarchaeum australiense]